MIDKNELLSLEKDVKNLLTIPRRMCEVQVPKNLYVFTGSFEKTSFAEYYKWG